MSERDEKPLHERVGILGGIRQPVRSWFFDGLDRALRTEDGRTIVRRAVLSPVRPEDPALAGLQARPTGYTDLGRAPEAARTARRGDLVFVTARFRSGSTLLWNLFRNLDGCTSYYEPLNERRWFDGERRGSRTDPTHQGVTDYWREYEGLEELGRLWRPEWHERDLLLPAEAWRPDLKRYLEVLAERAPARPVFQFNRMDFRLPWLRREFPNAMIVHLHRHPRDQWISSLVDPSRFRRDDGPDAFAGHDHFYLRLWAADLKHTFPFLDPAETPEPYRLFYFVWKLSWLFGRRWADATLSFESLVEKPRETIEGLLRELSLEGDPEALAALVTRPRTGKWREWADEDWFRGHESACEEVLDRFFGEPGGA